eukprot:PhF_6_TR28393/c0_g2_i1/m.42081
MVRAFLGFDFSPIEITCELEWSDEGVVVLVSNINYSTVIQNLLAVFNYMILANRNFQDMWAKRIVAWEKVDVDDILNSLSTFLLIMGTLSTDIVGLYDEILADSTPQTQPVTLGIVLQDAQYMKHQLCIAVAYLPSLLCGVESATVSFWKAIKTNDDMTVKTERGSTPQDKTCVYTPIQLILHLFGVHLSVGNTPPKASHGDIYITAAFGSGKLVLSLKKVVKSEHK